MLKHPYQEELEGRETDRPQKAFRHCIGFEIKLAAQGRYYPYTADREIAHG
jgi:hypothetical protein